MVLFGASKSFFDPNYSVQNAGHQSYQYISTFSLWGSSSPNYEKYIKMQNDPLTELYYKQVVDHNHPHKSGTFHQRYYENLHYWEGPGHPLFVILGGEGPLKHILYPYISLAVAKAFGGVTLNPEHRYYGKSFPVKNPSDHDLRKQLTPRQAMEDFVQFIKGMQEKLGCGPKGSPTYCPVVTIGGSYPVRPRL